MMPITALERKRWVTTRCWLRDPYRRGVGLLLLASAPLLASGGPIRGDVPLTQRQIEVLEPEVTLDLEPGRSKLIRTKRPVVRFSVTRPEVVEVVQHGPAEFELIAGRAGETSFTVWFSGPGAERTVLRYLVRVTRAGKR